MQTHNEVNSQNAAEQSDETGSSSKSHHARRTKPKRDTAMCDERRPRRRTSERIRMDRPPKESVPNEPAPSEPAPSEPAPSEPAPSEPAPSEPAPSEPAPSEPAPSGAPLAGVERIAQNISDKLTVLLDLVGLHVQASVELARAVSARAMEMKLRRNVLSFEEACAYLDISESHLYRLTSEGIVPHSKPNGKKLYFRRTELDAWLMSKPIKTQDEIEQEVASYCATHPTRRRRRRRHV